MIDVGKAATGQFCWVDLASTDADSAKAFYGRLLGWSPVELSVNGGSFTRLQLLGQDVGSLYQMRQAHVADGVPSHWTPYIRVNDVDTIARRAASIGGKVLVQPFEVEGVARIALILDSVGAHVGLWEPLKANREMDYHG
jgi:predicted enzyme related to lactoylglutathione lyase